MLPMREDRRRPERRLRRHQQRRPRARPYPRLRPRPTSLAVAVASASAVVPAPAPLAYPLLTTAGADEPPFSADRSAIMWASNTSNGDSELKQDYEIEKMICIQRHYVKRKRNKKNRKMHVALI